MVATDLASRGLDFSHVSHVINYDYPYGQESYTHRTGRTGRMGRPGVAMTFVTDHELGALKYLINLNHIHPVCHGNIPDLQTVSKLKGRQSDKKYLKKQPQRMSPKRIPSSSKDSNAVFIPTTGDNGLRGRVSPHRVLEKRP
jgi:ATP-dependent RNA helicase DeaD